MTYYIVGHSNECYVKRSLVETKLKIYLYISYRNSLMPRNGVELINLEARDQDAGIKDAPK